MILRRSAQVFLHLRLRQVRFPRKRGTLLLNILLQLRPLRKHLGVTCLVAMHLMQVLDRGALVQVRRAKLLGISALHLHLAACVVMKMMKLALHLALGNDVFSGRVLCQGQGSLRKHCKAPLLDQLLHLTLVQKLVAKVLPGVLLRVEGRKRRDKPRRRLRISTGKSGIYCCFCASPRKDLGRRAKWL